jgi:hypothetical protein
LILDARYERVREAGVIASQAVLIAIGIDWDGRRQILAVELANRESRSSWRDFLVGLKARGLHGVEFVVADAPLSQHGGSARAQEGGTAPCCLTPQPVQPRTVLARSRTLRAGSAGAAASRRHP